MSPDGHRVALTRIVGGNRDLWLLDVERSLLSRFTFDAGEDQRPLWAPDGGHIVFGSNRNGVFDLFQKTTAGAASEEPLLASVNPKGPTDWSRDGRFILYRDSDPKTSYDIWALKLDGDRRTFPVVLTSAAERDAQFSPDGKWIAYQSNESGRFEIYVQRFPGPGDKEPISAGGGVQARWRDDGKELFYIALDGRLMAVPITVPPDGHALVPGVSSPLFITHVVGGVPGADRQQYMVSPDGQRFLINTLTEEATAAPITVLLNWKPPMAK